MIKNTGELQVRDRINLKWYDDSYIYSDGDIEIEILAKLEQGITPDNMLISDNRCPIIYHFSPERQTIIDWIDDIRGAEVLEIGSGMGAITGGLCQLAKHVDCIELSLTRSKINQLRNSSHDNFEIIVANLNDVEFNKQYDIVTLIGVLEYCGRYTEDERDPYLAFLEKAYSLLKPGGKLILAIENRLGLKYFAGAREDHYGTLYEGLNNYPNYQGIKTFSYQELRELFTALNCQELDFYLPFPDYKFAQTIVAADDTDHYATAITQEDNYGAYPFQTFNQSTVFQTLAEQSDFKQFANSYLVIAEK